MHVSWFVPSSPQIQTQSSVRAPVPETRSSTINLQYLSFLGVQSYDGNVAYTNNIYVRENYKGYRYPHVSTHDLP